MTKIMFSIIISAGACIFFIAISLLVNGNLLGILLLVGIVIAFIIYANANPKYHTFIKRNK